MTREFDASGADEVSLDADDPRLAAPSSIRPFDGTPPYVHTIEMTSDETARIVERSRREQTTVRAAIVTAASRVRGAEFGEEFVRTFSPINIRELVGQGPNCCLCIASARTGMEPADGTDFWRQAREITRELNVARSAGCQRHGAGRRRKADGAPA